MLAANYSFSFIQRIVKEPKGAQLSCIKKKNPNTKTTLHLCRDEVLSKPCTLRACSRTLKGRSHGQRSCPQPVSCDLRIWRTSDGQGPCMALVHPGAAVPSLQPPQTSPTPAWGWLRGAHAWVVPPGPPYPAAPNPCDATSPNTFHRHNFLLTWRGTEVWNLVSNTSVAVPVVY